MQLIFLLFLCTIHNSKTAYLNHGKCGKLLPFFFEKQIRFKVNLVKKDEREKCSGGKYCIF